MMETPLVNPNDTDEELLAKVADTYEIEWKNLQVVHAIASGIGDEIERVRKSFRNGRMRKNDYNQGYLKGLVRVHQVLLSLDVKVIEEEETPTDENTNA